MSKSCGLVLHLLQVMEIPKVIRAWLGWQMACAQLAWVSPSEEGFKAGGEHCCLPKGWWVGQGACPWLQVASW